MIQNSTISLIKLRLGMELFHHQRCGGVSGVESDVQRVQGFILHPTPFTQPRVECEVPIPHLVGPSDLRSPMIAPPSLRPTIAICLLLPSCQAARLPGCQAVALPSHDDPRAGFDHNDQLMDNLVVLCRPKV
jgi:hypothetical protein